MTHTHAHTNTDTHILWNSPGGKESGPSQRPLPAQHTTLITDIMPPPDLNL